ncbi:RraA family protein [Vineibacter terrae]|uniref:Putative 4-hydroxy-4-methyl-2-oxoglutarate aldolase n=1 Tax=Vineibacter terrae TaxID=2586908 RepID=A0A5C8PJ63_9HYPH|nr:RraA family protein [Vineibacter terrae]TXL73851.1 RraA family protein [Vineibacter terrae]
MLDDPPILTIREAFTRPAADKVAALAGAQTGHLVDSMDGRGALDWRIKPLDPANAAFCGVAITAFAYPADNLGVFGALEQAQAGDVIIVANDGYTGTALVGDLVCGMMKNKGVAAFVTDGLARDRAGILATGLPVFCAGVSPNSPARTGPGTTNLPIQIAGVTVSPGDVIVGDADGVVVVPQAMLDGVIERLKAIRTAEAAAEAKVKGGATMNAAAGRILKSDRVKRI